MNDRGIHGSGPWMGKMNLWLISDSDGRALAIRDHILSLLRQHGELRFNATRCG